MTILFVRGAPDDNTGRFSGLDARGNISWVLGGCCDVEQYVDLPADAAAAILLFGPEIEQSEITFHRQPSLIFNQIADADSHAGSLKRCAELCRQLDGVPVINHPDKVLATTRDLVSAALQGIPEVRMPRTVRARPLTPDQVFEAAGASGIDLPLLVRLPGFHNGRNMVLLRSRADYDLLHALPFDGREFYLTEFIDYRNHKGVYTKTRIAMLDGEPYFRHFLYDDDWMIHASSIRFMEQNPQVYSKAEMDDRWTGWVERARPAFAAIHERIGLDYYGIDCHVHGDGRVLVFEANATMNFLTHGMGLYVEFVKALRLRVRALMERRSGETLA